MLKKPKTLIIVFLFLILFATYYIATWRSAENPTEFSNIKTQLINQKKEKTENNLLANENITFNEQTAQTNNLNSSKEESSDKANKSAKKEKGVEQLIVTENFAINTDFIKAIQDEEIFYLTLDVLNEEEQSSLKATQNKTKFSDAYNQKYDDYMQSNENAAIDLNEIQCGDASCLMEFSSLELETFKDFFNQLSEIQNLMYTSSIVSVIQENGTYIHRVLVSVDESVDAIAIPPYNHGG